MAYLHNEFSTPGHAPFSDEGVHWLFLLLSLLNLNQPRDGVDALAIIRIGLLLQLDEILGLFSGSCSL